MKDWIDGAAKAIALLTFSAVCLSVVYELGFYSELDPALQTFMAPTDYLSNAVQWLPWAMVIFLGSTILAILTLAPIVYKLFSGADGQGEISTSSGLLGLVSKPWTVILFQFVLFAGIYFLQRVDGVHPMMGMILFASCVSLLLYWVNGWAVFQATFNTVRARTIVALLVTQIPACIGFVYAWGISEAITMMDRPGQIYLVERKGDVSLSRQIIRNLGAGLLVRESSSGQISLLKWDEVRSITTVLKSPDRRSPFCRITGYFC